MAWFQVIACVVTSDSEPVERDSTTFDTAPTTDTATVTGLDPSKCLKNGAEKRTRTADLLITNQWRGARIGS